MTIEFDEDRWNGTFTEKLFCGSVTGQFSNVSYPEICILVRESNCNGNTSLYADGCIPDEELIKRIKACPNYEAPILSEDDKIILKDMAEADSQKLNIINSIISVGDTNLMVRATPEGKENCSLCCLKGQYKCGHVDCSPKIFFEEVPDDKPAISRIEVESIAMVVASSDTPAETLIRFLKKHGVEVLS